MSDIGAVVQTLEDRRDDARLRIAAAYVAGNDVSTHFAEYRAVIETIKALNMTDYCSAVREIQAQKKSELAYQAA